MSDNQNILFSPWSLGDMKLPNRVVMAPMTRQFSPGGIPGPDVAAYYRRRAEGGVGLILTEGTTINDPAASMHSAIPRFHGDDALAGWKHVVDEVHAAGGKIMPQIWHVGSARKPADSPNPEAGIASPSGYIKPGKQVAEGMSEDHIEQVIEAYADAAADAERLGFDGVEVHGAHGYLIDQFFWGATNQRDDKWGGDLVGRTRFGVEVIKAIRRKVSADFPVVLRYSQWKQQDYTQRLCDTPAELEAFLTPLSEAGVDIFHASTRRYWEPEFEGSDLNLAGWTRKLTGKPTITVGSVGLNGDFLGAFAGQGSEIRLVDDLLERLEQEEFDLVAVGRAVLQDPEWANKVRDGRLDELSDYSADSLQSLA